MEVYCWGGNVCEVCNFVVWLVIFYVGEVVDVKDLFGIEFLLLLLFEEGEVFDSLVGNEW